MPELLEGPRIQSAGVAITPVAILPLFLGLRIGSWWYSMNIYSPAVYVMCKQETRMGDVRSELRVTNDDTILLS